MPHRFHVLIIDDNRADLLLATEAFQDRDQHVTVTSCTSGEEALTHLNGLPHEGLPHVIVLDLNMPVMNGFEVLRRLKLDDRLQVIPVVMLSTSAAPGDVAQAYSLHASAYLVKAPDFTEFLEQVDRFLLYWKHARLPHRPALSAH